MEQPLAIVIATGKGGEKMVLRVLPAGRWSEALLKTFSEAGFAVTKSAMASCRAAWTVESALAMFANEI
jgi:hypothetical protein